MTFANYVNVLKKHFKQSISNNMLCGILFDAIILPLDLKKRNGEDFIVDKAEISRIMNGKKKIPTALQEHIWDKPVLDGLEKYFETNIVAELVPDTSDLCHQLINLIEQDENISPAHKATLHLSANPKSTALFLAEAFIYVVKPDSISETIKPSVKAVIEKPILKICGIAATNELSDKVEAVRFHPKHEYTLAEYEVRIRQLYEEIANFQVGEEYCSAVEKFHQPIYQHFERMTPWITPVEISEHDELIVKTFAKEIRFTLPKDFFDFGDLRKESALLSPDPPRFYGNERGKIKYKKIDSLLKSIESYRELKPIDSAFENTFCIRLALRNVGQTFDEDINVRLMIDKNSLLTSKYLDDYIIRDILDKFDDIFEIKRDKNYFEHDNITNISKLPRIPLLGKDRNLAEEWEELFPYFMSTEGELAVFELNFEKILHNTAISFPTVILLKKYVPLIKYEIRSKFMSEIVSGSLQVFSG